MSHLFYAKQCHHLVVPDECVYRAYEVLASEGRKQDSVAKNKGNVDLSDPVSVARTFGTTEKQLKVEEIKILKDAEQRKKKEDKAREKKAKKTTGANNPELEQVRGAIGESIDVSHQIQLMEAFDKEKREQDRARVNPRQHPANIQSPQAGSNGLQKQNSWQPQGTPHHYDTIPGDDKKSPSTRPRLAEHGKADTVGGVHEQVHQRQRPIEQSQGTRYQQGEHSNPLYVNQPPPPGQYNDRQQGQQDGYNYPQQNNNYYEGDQQYDNIQQNQPPAYNHGEQMQHTDQSNVRPQETPAGREQYPPSNAHQSTPGPFVVAHTGDATVPANYNLGVESTVQLASTDPNTPYRYGVIRWTGTLPQAHGEIAGIELVSQ